MMDSTAHTSPTIKSVQLINRRLDIELLDGSVLPFEDCWLRDNCRCSECYHADTFQRAKHILEIPDSKINQYRFNRSHIYITWDDKHESQYEATFLSQFEYKKWSQGGRLRPQLWRGADVATQVSRVHVDKFLNSVDGAKAVFQSLLDYGVALIEGVEVSVEGTELVCRALGGVQHTLFGDMWRFTTRADHADTAYTSLALAPHTDNTYFTEAAGLQILHCLEHSNGSGGETVLADGFYGAARLREEHPGDFQFLSTFNLEAEYIEQGHHHKHSAPVLHIDGRTGDLKQIRFNVYDRSTMAFSSGAESRWYWQALRNLAAYYQDTSNQWRFKLTPGVVMVMDNFRVLHGRTAFTGDRVMCGSYVARSDWLDRARALKLIQ